MNEKHPAWGIIALSHIHSNGSDLFLSPTRSHGYVRLTIHQASLQRSEHNGMSPWPEEHIIDVALSATQFAEMITQPNRGQGVACTITRLQAKRVDDTPPIGDELHDAAGRAKQRGIYESVRLVDEVITGIDGILSQGGRATVAQLRKIREDLAVARTRGSVDLDYWRKEVTERAHNLRAKVATELHATADLIVRNMGLEALREKARAMLPTMAPAHELVIEAEPAGENRTET